ncbi:GDP-mannose-dependent alpha-(1-6)-phosphatidylinositol dimannoside mannosyltransferase [Streptomyces cinnamoneus]|uniref:GDP-mannose-dependent alpha-(1-6)-phosphatidylinositol dimannoside mannosyltransferase n=1 Tax=Streptomyces cinnamoneus TaxID=53446 RepID=A0A918WH95_STRCJ|nr:GDP-mannose-dependent alpha-(1-6)-phosphatidylinositol dimannoside mannosyltransferase [Streptomyces cinnamoneus]
MQLAGFYGPASGGLRTTVDALGRGYVAAGHERVLVVPGGGYGLQRTAVDGLRLTVPGVPVGGGYRLVLAPPVLRGLRALLGRLGPDVVEVSDKLTLVHAARRARARGVRTVLLSHERLDAILAPRVPAVLPLGRAADAWNRRLAGAFDAVVAASAFSCAEFARVGAPALHRVALGVDLQVFHPAAGGAAVQGGRPAPAGGNAEVRLVYAGRLSAEKCPQLLPETLRVLRRWGVAARLDVLGDGPERARLRRGAAGLPVRFHGHVNDRRVVAAVTAAADVALAPCPVEAFGLSVLEALACGTPVVTADRGAAQELLAPGAGLAVPASAEAMAAAVVSLTAQSRERRRAAARARAEEFPWARTVAGLLAVHAGTG